MLFDEIYGSYYNTVAEILAEAVDGTLTEAKMRDIISNKAFGESMLTIPGALASGEWPLLTEGFGTPIRHEPKMPLTTLQKRWLKSLLSDPRIRLFEVSDEGLEDVEPLYENEAVVYFDRYTDGDDYENEEYIAVFRTVIQALKTHRMLDLKYFDSEGNMIQASVIPLKIEYSLKEDRFRLLTADQGTARINISDISECRPAGCYDPKDVKTAVEHKKQVTLELTDERNALDRAMLHFSSYEKETVRFDQDRYRIHIWYHCCDETELVERVLSFGPMIKAAGPEDFKTMIREKLDDQKRFI